MQSYEESTMSAKARLLQAECALDDYVHSSENNLETLKQLSDAVHSARCEVLDLFSALWTERDLGTNYPLRRHADPSI